MLTIRVLNPPTILCISHIPYLGSDWSVYEDQQGSSDADDEHSLSETTDGDHGDFEPDDVSSSDEDAAERKPRVRQRATKLRQACTDWQDQTADALAAMHQMPHGQTCTIKHPEICLLDAVYRLTFLIFTDVSNFFLSVSVNTHKYMPVPDYHHHLQVQKMRASPLLVRSGEGSARFGGTLPW